MIRRDCGPKRKSDAPLLVNPKPSWHKLSWFAEFIGSMPNYRRNTMETTRLAIAAPSSAAIRSSGTAELRAPS